MEMDDRAFNKTLNKDILNTTYLSNNNKASKQRQQKEPHERKAEDNAVGLKLTLNDDL